ncbi:tetratricopeptide repeat protein, partial [Teladorsagia circumcincta]
MQNVIGLLASLFVSINGDLFTSVADMQGLLDSEKSIPALLHKYIESERNRLDELRKLELLFKLSIIAGDCFEVGKAAYHDGDYYHTIMWMEEAKRRLEKEDEPTAALSEILEYLSFSLYKQGNLKHALKFVEELYKIEPTHPRAKGNIKWYEDLLAEEGVRKADMRRALGPIRNERPISVLGNEERTIYEALCRNEVPVSPKEISKLYCYYKRDRPFLVYAPIK